MEERKLTPEELQEFQNNRTEANRLAAVLGEIHFQRTLLDLELENLKEAVKANAIKQRNQLKQLGEKYGDGSIDPETGTITSVLA
jgi:K+/H+ antiporter YhaU regulatory subunit KhtT